jgi:hypothetical protein
MSAAFLSFCSCARTYLSKYGVMLEDEPPNASSGIYGKPIPVARIGRITPVLTAPITPRAGNVTTSAAEAKSFLPPAKKSVLSRSACFSSSVKSALTSPPLSKAIMPPPAKSIDSILGAANWSIPAAI